MAWDNDIGDEPQGAIRDRPPDILGQIDPGAPVSGHHPAEDAQHSLADEPEHDWTAASERLMPLLRPPGSGGASLAGVDREQLAIEGLRSHAQPVVDDGPAGLVVAYGIRAGGFDVLVNADHLLAWGIEPAALRSAAMGNLARWSAGAPWTDEAKGQRRILSSDTGDGSDAARILLPEVRRYLTTELGGAGRVLVGVPERHLLVAGTLSATDPEFADLFRDFVGAHADDADESIDRRLFELIDGELTSFWPEAQ
jgi:hypothetical protein